MKLYIKLKLRDTVLHLTRFEFLGQLLSAHQDREGIPATVGFVDFSDLYCVIHQEILDGYRPGLPVQRVSVVPKGKEMQHLTKQRLRAWNQSWYAKCKISGCKHLIDNANLYWHCKRNISVVSVVPLIFRLTLHFSKDQVLKGLGWRNMNFSKKLNKTTLGDLVDVTDVQCPT